MRIPRRIRHRVFAATIAAGALGLTAAGATAFTASTTFTNTNTHVGYGVETVSGAEVTSISYGLSSDGSTIESVTIVTDGDTSGSSAAVGFTVGGTAQPTTACGAGTYSTPDTDTTYICGSTIGQAVSTVQSTNVVVY